MGSGYCLVHAAHIGGCRRGRGGLGLVGHQRLGGQQDGCHRGGVLQSGAGHLGGVHDAGGDHVAVGLLIGIEAIADLTGVLDLLQHHGAVDPGIDGDLLHAALVNDMDQKDMAMDFRIFVENEKAVLAMDYQDMTIYWVYGIQEDAPAIGNDESQDDTAYPGADIVEIVNLRGDETTIYTLSDGTYMDRMERRFTYNGTDIWTDEDGVEWNEAAKD